MTNNAELIKAFEKAFSVSNSVPNGREKETLEKMVMQYASARKIQCTSAEVEEAVANGLSKMQHAVSDYSYEAKAS